MLQNPLISPAPSLPKATASQWSFEHLHLAFHTFPKAPCACREASSCSLLVCLAGELQRPAKPSQNTNITLSAGYCALNYHPSCLQYAYSSTENTQVLELTCPAKTLIAFLRGTPLATELEKACQGCQDFCIEKPLKPSLCQSLLFLHKAAENAAPGAPPLLLSKMFEALWGLSKCAVPPKSEPAAVPQKTRQTIEQLCTILENNLCNPPTMEELATQANMSVSKLKQVFPRVCGMPPFAYLRQIRMERAMQLLRQEDTSVTEVAFDVGYTSLSHFAKTFATHYGIKPSQVRVFPKV